MQQMNSKVLGEDHVQLEVFSHRGDGTDAQQKALMQTAVCWGGGWGGGGAADELCRWMTATINCCCRAHICL